MIIGHGQLDMNIHELDHSREVWVLSTQHLAVQVAKRFVSFFCASLRRARLARFVPLVLPIKSDPDTKMPSLRFN